MIEIKPYNLHWLKCEPGEDNTADLCAHGSVAITVDGKRFVPEDEYCVSAAALYLLRTLDDSYKRSPNDEQLIPCCGHSMYEREDSQDVLIVGCPNGYDFIVERQNGKIRLTFDENEVFEIGIKGWEKAVCQFSDQVQQLYDVSSEKECADEISKSGYTAFRCEWKRRRDEFSS